MIPIIFPSAGKRPLYKCLDSGISSQETIYSIAPAAKPKDIDTKFEDILDIIAPANAPIPVVIPEIIVINIAFRELNPPFFRGRATEIPSGISCMQIAIARDRPKLSEAIKPLPYC